MCIGGEKISNLRHAELQFSLCNRLITNIGSGVQNFEMSRWIVLIVDEIFFVARMILTVHFFGLIKNLMRLHIYKDSN
jgi:hypothetical protein